MLEKFVVAPGAVGRGSSPPNRGRSPAVGPGRAARPAARSRARPWGGPAPPFGPPRPSDLLPSSLSPQSVVSVRKPASLLWEQPPRLGSCHVFRHPPLICSYAVRLLLRWQEVSCYFFFYSRKVGRAPQLSAAGLCATLVPVVTGGWAACISWFLFTAHSTSNLVKSFSLKACRKVCGALMLSEELAVVKGRFPARLPCPGGDGCLLARAIDRSLAQPGV